MYVTITTSHITLTRQLRTVPTLHDSTDSYKLGARKHYPTVELVHFLREMFSLMSHYVCPPSDIWVLVVHFWNIENRGRKLQNVVRG